MKLPRTTCPRCGRDVPCGVAPGGDGTAYVTRRHPDLDTGRPCRAVVDLDDVRDGETGGPL